jgi:hypothetical protein
MKTYRINSVMAGTLYLLGTVFGVLGGIIGGKVLGSLISGTPLAGVDMLGLAAAESSKLIAGAFFTFMMGISLMAMTLFLYPVFKKDSEELALGLVLFRGALEGTSYFVSALGMLSMVAIGGEYLAAGTGSTALQSMSNVLYQFMNLKTPFGTFAFLIGATCLYLSFYRTRLIPRWLTIWGLIGVVPYLANAVFHLLQVDPGFGMILEIPLAIQELVMGAWLVIKGFTPKAIAAIEVKDLKR